MTNKPDKIHRSLLTDIAEEVEERKVKAEKRLDKISREDEFLLLVQQARVDECEKVLKIINKYLN